MGTEEAGRAVAVGTGEPGGLVGVRVAVRVGRAVDVEVGVGVDVDVGARVDVGVGVSWATTSTTPFIAVPPGKLWTLQ